MAEIQGWTNLARRLLYSEHPPLGGQSKGKPMFDRQFFRSKLGKAAALSVAAMLAMNIVALNAQLHAVPSAYAASAQTTVELA